jgi:adenine-specific DNA methylase
MRDLTHTGDVPAAYRAHRRMAPCPVCGRLVPVVGGDLTEWHFAQTGHRVLCKGSAQPVEPADALGQRPTP